MASDTTVTVTETSQTITFQPTANQDATGLLFYPGAMVEPTAYAPPSRTMAEAGYLTIIVKLPWGADPLASHEAQLWQITQTVMTEETAVQQWVNSGHSRGMTIAARTVYAHEDRFAGLVLIRHQPSYRRRSYSLTRCPNPRCQDLRHARWPGQPGLRVAALQGYCRSAGGNGGN